MSSTTEAALASWRDAAATRAILEFVAAATHEGDEGYIPPAERIAVFDNDGTLWTEKPMPVQLDFIVRGFAADVRHDPALRDRQPDKAAPEANGFVTFIVAGNSNGDLEMLRCAGGAGKPALRLAVVHDDGEREVDDRGGAEHVLGVGFTEISMRDDWATVYRD
jgi:hypothetical protein